MQALKILLPHIGLTVLLLCYIAGGAVIFKFLESEAELEKRRLKVDRVLDLYKDILSNATTMCGNRREVS